MLFTRNVVVYPVEYNVYNYKQGISCNCVHTNQAGNKYGLTPQGEWPLFVIRKMMRFNSHSGK